LRASCLHLRTASTPLLTFLVLLPVVLQGQTQGCTEINPPCPPDQPPTIGVGGGGTYSTDSPAFGISMFDDYGLNMSSLTVSDGTLFYADLEPNGSTPTSGTYRY